MWICVGPRDPSTKPSRGWLRVVVRKPRFVLSNADPTRNKVTAKTRTNVLGCNGRNDPEEALGILSARNDFAVRAAEAHARDTAHACRLACAIGHGRRARHLDSGSRATSRSRPHQ